MMQARMEQHSLTRAYLETLSNGDLVSLADRYGLDMPSELNRRFVVEELLEASADVDSAEVEDGALRDEDGEEAPEGIPETYNESFVNVLLRDPVWAYVFWEIKTQDRQAREHEADFEGYFLRVSGPRGAKAGGVESSFVVPVGKLDDAWYLCLPGETGWYRIDLCAVMGKSEDLLASSPPFRVPRGRIAVSETDLSVTAAEMLALSGISELRVLQAVDRQSRLPARCEA